MSMNVRVKFRISFEQRWNGEWSEEAYEFPYQSMAFTAAYRALIEIQQGNNKVATRNVKAYRVTYTESQIEIYP